MSFLGRVTPAHGIKEASHNIFALWNVHSKDGVIFLDWAKRHQQADVTRLAALRKKGARKSREAVEEEGRLVEEEQTQLKLGWETKRKVVEEKRRKTEIGGKREEEKPCSYIIFLTSNFLLFLHSIGEHIFNGIVATLYLFIISLHAFC